MQQKIFILGIGNVGKELIKRVVEKDSADFHNNPTIIVGLAEPGKFLFSPEGIPVDDLLMIAKAGKTVGGSLETGKSYNKMEELVEMVQKANLDGEVIFVDATAGKDVLLNFHKYVITQSQNSIVTANKNPIALGDVEDFHLLTQFHHRYDANVTVMGGAGVVPFLNERKEIRDDIQNIQGCFSGTLGYILSELEKEQKLFSEIVREANELGYTEPNPWDDLNGLDVARKILILARYAGYDVRIEQVKIRPLIEDSFGKLSGEEFWNKLKEKDKYFMTLQKEAVKERSVLRYVAEMDVDQNKKSVDLRVGLKKMPRDSEFGTLKGTANLVVIETDTLNQPVPHVIKSRGAGLAVTADALRTGILRLMPYGAQRYKDKI